MIDLLQDIVDFLVTAVEFIINLLKNLLMMIAQIPKYLEVMLSFFGFLPDWLLPTLMIVLFAGLILYLLGR